MLSEINISFLLPISISFLSLVISLLVYRQNKRNRVEDTKNKLYEKLLDTALLAENNVQQLLISDRHVSKLFPDGSESFKDQREEAERLRMETRTQIERVRSIKLSNRKKVREAFLDNYYQVGELYVAVKTLNDVILSANGSLEMHLARKRA
ncbi:hypothetical protein F6X00_25095 [Vibrio vulnificus]|uniref:hypothetical protein n=1 Tax=Vibrio vulnificus TaxID=672 RepID=UPI0004D5601D|nr:hypothetical protein [Vibrio vulnificus]OAR45087.1 hypothetical protein EM55_023735 [Vibrio parahaemolyticus]MCA0765448.1 hypothetical protein [Vibrio vulnificus]MDT9656003.1 hypothetical protein [Vibrio vulnificus]OOQ77371.1 hypothetical protein BSR65_21655 [Vibrio parahaemolyticus]PMT69024.1 hypothetical protein C1S93_23630 [Vibrio parahaemolyticus]